MNEIIKQGASEEGKHYSHLIVLAIEKEQICMLIDVIEDRSDIFLIYELCPGKTMNEHLFDVKGEFYEG